MSLRVQIQLSKALYLPGEVVDAHVNILNSCGNDSSIESPLYIKEFHAQALGWEKCDSSWLSSLNQPEYPASKSESRIVYRFIFTSEEILLLSDAVLQSKDTRNFRLRFRLPQNIPPTFRGSSIKFLYSLELLCTYMQEEGNGEQATFETTATTTINVSVWPMTRLMSKRNSSLGGHSNTSNTVGSISNSLPMSGKPQQPEELEPVVINYKINQSAPRLLCEELSVFDGSTIMQNRSSLDDELSMPEADAESRQLDEGTGKKFGSGAASITALDKFSTLSRSSTWKNRHPNFGKVYSLNAGQEATLKVILQPPLEMPLQPGATFGGLLDYRSFISSTPLQRCQEILVLLESEEVVNPEFCSARRRRQHIIRALHCEHHEVCSDLVLGHFLFTVPPYGTPSYKTPMVTFRWVLRFELTLITKGKKAPEKLVWSLPLLVLPPAAHS